MVIMTLHFRGGELIQKGKGVGGFFRSLAAIAKPVIASIGKNALLAVKSKTGKKIARSLGKQTANSVLNIVCELVRGGDIKKTALNERSKFKNLGVNKGRERKYRKQF